MHLRTRSSLYLDGLRRDIGYGIRALRKSPGYAAVSVATLSVGIGAVATIFSLVNAILLHPLPYAHADRTVRMVEHNTEDADFISPAVIATVRRASSAFDGLAVYRANKSAVLSSGADAGTVQRVDADSALFQMLGIRAERGRLFAADDYQPGSAPVVISDELWRGQFGGDEHIINSVIRIDGAPHTVIGVVPPGLRFPDRTDLWFPLDLRISASDSGIQDWLQVLGRLRPGKSLADARRELDLIARGMRTADPQRFGQESIVATADIAERGTLADGAFIIVPFLLASLCVPLVACANVGSLLLIRGAGRQREMAIRAALGGVRSRLLQQSLAESLILGVVSGAVGAALSVAGVKVILALISADGLPSWLRFGIDARVLIFTIVLSLIVTAAVGLAPARQATRADLAYALKAGGDGSIAGGVASRGAQWRTAVELAVSLLLFFVAASLWQSGQRTGTTDLGFERNRIMVVDGLTLDRRRYPTNADGQRLGHEVLDLLNASPVVDATALTADFSRFRSDPEGSRRAIDGSITPELGTPQGALYRFGDFTRPINWAELAGQTSTTIEETTVSMSLPRVMGLSVRTGRWFRPADDSASPAVAVVTERLARIIEADGSIVGQVLQIGMHGRPFTIVGVVSDVRTQSSDNFLVPRGDAALYFSDQQTLGAASETGMRLVVRAKAQASTLPGVVRHALHEADPDVPMTIGPLEADIDAELRIVRAADAMIGAFALMALLLAMLGTYGLIGYDVARRSREIGIRIALGGSTGDVMRWVVGRSARHIAIGLASGLVLGLVATRMVDSQLWGFSATSVGLDASVVGVFALVALVACYLPARRVAHADPVGVLKAE